MPSHMRMPGSPPPAATPTSPRDTVKSIQKFPAVTVLRDSPKRGHQWSTKTEDMLRRLTKEIKHHHPPVGLHPRPLREIAEDRATSAACYKAAMVHCMGVITCVPTPKISYNHYDRMVVWNYVSHEQRRFKGKKEDYFVITTHGRRLAVLHVPPKIQSEAAASAHAKRQATY